MAYLQNYWQHPRDTQHLRAHCWSWNLDNRQLISPLRRLEPPYSSYVPHASTKYGLFHYRLSNKATDWIVAILDLCVVWISALFDGVYGDPDWGIRQRSRWINLSVGQPVCLSYESESPYITRRPRKRPGWWISPSAYPIAGGLHSVKLLVCYSLCRRLTESSIASDLLCRTSPIIAHTKFASA
jgi:hypothetical protein